MNRPYDDILRRGEKPFTDAFAFSADACHAENEGMEQDERQNVRQSLFPLFLHESRHSYRLKTGGGGLHRHRLLPHCYISRRCQVRWEGMNVFSIRRSLHLGRQSIFITDAAEPLDMRCCHFSLPGSRHTKEHYMRRIEVFAVFMLFHML